MKQTLNRVPQSEKLDIWSILKYFLDETWFGKEVFLEFLFGLRLII